MAQLMPNPKQQYFDNNGDPLVGGKIFFFVVGTDVPRDTWQDMDKTVLNTNPVILDARGEGIILLEGNYRVVVKDSKDNLIYDIPVVSTTDGQIKELNDLVNQKIIEVNAAAELAAHSAEMALVGADLYPNEPTGRAAVADGAYFKVVGTGGVAAYQYKRINATTSEYVTAFPSKEGLNSLASLAAVCPWLDKTAFSLPDSGATDWFIPIQHRVEAALAIKSARVENGVINEKYLIGVFCNSDPVQKDRISIFAVSSGTTVVTTGAVDIVKNTNDLTRVVVGDTQNAASIRVILDIDYREITSIGTLVSGATAPLRIARANTFTVLQRYHDNEVLPAWIKQEYRSAVLFGHDRWREAAAGVKGVTLYHTDPAKAPYRITVISKDDPTFQTRIAVSNSDGVGVCAGTMVTAGTGLMRMELANLSSSGTNITGVVHFNFSNIQGPFVISDSNSNLVIDENFPDIYEQARTDPPRIDALEWPQWLSRLSTPSPTHLEMAKHFYAIDLHGTNPSETYGLSVVTKQDPGNGDRIFIRDSVTTVARWIPPAEYVPSPDGVDRIVLDEWGNSGVSGVVYVNWAALGTGNLLVQSIPTLFIDTTTMSGRDAKEQIQILENKIDGITGGSSSVDVSPTPIRAAIAGSSITWGQGYLGQLSYVGSVEAYLRNVKAQTIHADALAPTALPISQNNFYLGNIRRLEGVNASAEFNMTGDELTINVVKERGNPGAALIDLYVDGVVFDTFSTVNTEPAGSDTKIFTGNGSDVKFDLGQCFTYDHAVTVAGVAKVGSVNIQGSGASIPASDDYMVVRFYNESLNQVTHILWFKTAPTGEIVCNYKYGETIAYMKGTLANSGLGIDTPLESAFGDGAVSEDTTAPASISSGLGFRESDPRACVTYMFGESKTRNFRLVVRALDPSATGTTPYLDLNFVTNRMHHIMNAGIGGWTAAYLLTHSVLLNRIDRVAEWSPDVLLLESCTNDDWLTHQTKGWVTRTGVTNAQLKAEETSNYLNSITGPSDNKTVQDDRLPITGVTANTVTIDTTNATVTAQPGDAVIIGSFHGDHRRVAVRIIDTYAGGVITFKKPISASEFAQAKVLSDLIGQWVLLKAAPLWASQVEQCVQVVTDQNPDCEVHIATAGAPNYNHRRLFGYRELGQALAKQHDWGFVDFYDATVRFQYNQPFDGRLYIGSGSTTTSTGAASYPLLRSNGADPSDRLIHKPRVMVNGVDRTNQGCHIEGGYSYTWSAGVADPTLSNDALIVKPYRLIFTDNIPPAGDTIEIYYATRIWSGDDTHPGRLDLGQFGIPVFGVAATDIL